MRGTVAKRLRSESRRLGGTAGQIKRRYRLLKRHHSGTATRGMLDELRALGWRP